jgi:hypothetical protein
MGVAAPFFSHVLVPSSLSLCSSSGPTLSRHARTESCSDRATDAGVRLPPFGVITLEHDDDEKRRKNNRKKKKGKKKKLAPRET